MCGLGFALNQTGWFCDEGHHLRRNSANPMSACSDDIRNQLPQEAKRFDTIDKAWLKIMSDTAKNTNVLEACSAEGRYNLIVVWHLRTCTVAFVWLLCMLPGHGA